MYNYRAKVDKFVDGDTIDFTVDLGFGITMKLRGRLINVDTPERGHPDWFKATDECRRLVRTVADIINESSLDNEEWWVTINTSKTEKYGRWLVNIVGVNDKLAEIWPYNR